MPSNGDGSSQRVILITGAGGSLGRELTKAFMDVPEKPVLTLSDVRADALTELSDELPLNATVETVVADVTKRRSIRSLIDGVVDRHGRIDVLINNAGVVGTSGRIHNQSASDWAYVIQTNLLSVAYGMAAAVPHMQKSGGGTIVNTASVAGMTAWTHFSPYGATKAAVIHLTKIAALEYARDNIRVNCVCPGQFESSIYSHLPAEGMERVAAQHPLGSGEPKDVVGAFKYLAGDEARWTTGSVVVVDGGYSLP